MKRIFAINLGSTSTKVAYYEDEQCIVREDVLHSPDELGQAPSIMDQYAFRRRDIEQFMNEHAIHVANLDALVSRGGLTQALEAGTYRIDEDMLEQAESGRYGIHPCNLGYRIVFDMVQGTDAIPMTVDVPVLCEMDPVALYSGLPGVVRKPASQPLNSRAVARAYARKQGVAFEKLRLLVVNLGAGITVSAFQDGRIIDTQDGAAGDGCFCANRCNGVPVAALVDLCYSGEYTYEQMRSLLYSESGLKGYVGEIDVRIIEQHIKAGSEKHREVLSAMCYQIAKEIGGLAAVLEGRVDAIIFTGNLAKSAFVTEYLERKVSFIAPVVHMPGQLEMEALWEGAYRALKGEEPLKSFATHTVDIESMMLA